MAIFVIGDGFGQRLAKRVEDFRIGEAQLSVTHTPTVTHREPFRVFVEMGGGRKQLIE